MPACLIVSHRSRRQGAPLLTGFLYSRVAFSQPVTAPLRWDRSGPRAIRPGKERVMGTETLYIRDERGAFIPAKGETVVEAAKAHLSLRVRRGITLTSPRLVRDYLVTKLGSRDCEYFCVVLVDTRHRLIELVELVRATIDGASSDRFVRGSSTAYTQSPSTPSERLTNHHPRTSP